MASYTPALSKGRDSIGKASFTSRGWGGCDAPLALLGVLGGGSSPYPSGRGTADAGASYGS